MELRETAIVASYTQQPNRLCKRGAFCVRNLEDKYGSDLIVITE